MKIAVVSDTHDHMSNIEKVVSKLNESNTDALIHCGDYISPFTARVFENLREEIKDNFYGVFGNNDGERLGLKKHLGQFCQFAGEELLMELDGKKIYARHVVDERVVDSLAQSGKFDIILYGHTHGSKINLYDNNVLLVNPGEVCGYLSGDSSFALVDTKTMKAEVITL